MHSVFLVSSNASKPNLSLYSYGNSGFFIQQNKFIVIYNASVIAFQEKIPSIFKGCYCCYKSKKYRHRRRTQKYTILSILLLAATTGLIPVLLLQCCPRCSSPSWYLKVPTISQRLQSLTGRYLLCSFSVLVFVFWIDKSQSVFVLQMQIYIYRSFVASKSFLPFCNYW